MPTTLSNTEFIEIFHEEILAAPRVSSSCKKMLRALLGEHPDQPGLKGQPSPFDERETPPLVSTKASPRIKTRKVQRLVVNKPSSKSDNIGFEEDRDSELERHISELLMEGLNLREVVAALNEERTFVKLPSVSYHSIQKIVRRNDSLYAMYKSDFTA